MTPLGILIMLTAIATVVTLKNNVASGAGL